MLCPWQCAELEDEVCGECEFDFRWLQQLGWGENSLVRILSGSQYMGRYVAPTRDFGTETLTITNDGVIKRKGLLPPKMIDWIHVHRVTRGSGHHARWKVEKIKRAREENPLPVIIEEETKRRKKDIIMNTIGEKEEETLELSTGVFRVIKIREKESLESLLWRNIGMLQNTLAKHLGLKVSNYIEMNEYAIFSNACLPQKCLDLSNFFIILIFRLEEDASSLILENHFTQLCLRFVTKSMYQFELRCDFY